MLDYRFLKEVKEEVKCRCGEKWINRFPKQQAPFRWYNEKYPQHQAGMEEMIVNHEDGEGSLLHLQIHKCWCGATIMVLLRTEEDTITAGHMEVYPTHNEVLNDDLL